MEHLTESSSAPRADDVVVLRLFVAGNAPNSVEARANIALLCERANTPIDVEVVDVFDDVDASRAAGIVVTPTLIREAPGPPMRIIGTLDDLQRVARRLDLNLDDEL